MEVDGSVRPPQPPPGSADEPAERRNIPHEELMQLPIVQYRGAIRLIETEDDLHRASREIRSEHVVGFDTETRPTFRKGQFHSPSLVQIATDQAVYLFPIARMNCSEVLTEVFGNAKIIKAGVALARDLSELQKLFPFKPVNVVDLGDIAKHRGMAQTGLRNLTGLFLGGRITKGPQTSNWAQPKLTHKQQIYAATDAWACRELYLRFESLGWLTTPKNP